MARRNGSAGREQPNDRGEHADDLDDLEDDDLPEPRVTERDRHGRQRPIIIDRARRIVQDNGGDGELATMAVMQQNYDLRDERRELRGTVRELRRQLPGEQDVVLRGDDAAAYNALKELGLTAAQIKELQAKAATADRAEAARQQQESADKAATLADPAQPWNAKLLSRLITQDALVLEFRSVTRPKTNGEQGTETIEVPYVRKASDTNAANAQPLAEYAAAQWGDFPLAATDNGSGGEGGAGGTGATRPAGASSHNAAPSPSDGQPRVIRYAPQGASGRAPTADPTGDYMGARYKGPRQPRRNDSQGASDQ